MLQHLLLGLALSSWDADEDVPEINWEYLRTVTAVMISMVFNFL